MHKTTFLAPVDSFLKIAARVIRRLGKKRKPQDAQDLPKNSLLPRKLEPCPTPAEFRLGAADQARTIEPEAPDNPAMDDVDSQNHHRAEMYTETSPNLPKPQQKPLDELATLIRSLSYGEMMELCETIWRVQPDGSPVTQEDLPALLYRWATSRAATPHDDSKE